MRRTLLSAAWVIAVLALAPAAIAIPLGSAVALNPQPGSGGPHTTFRLSFRSPDATGQQGSVTRRDTLSVAGPGHRNCVSEAAIALPPAKVGAWLRIALNPRSLGGRWCKGQFRGQILESQNVGCGPPTALIMCPEIMIAPRVVAQFRFSVR